MNSGRPMVGVIGSGSDTHSNLSLPLGNFLAEKGCNLINGGGQGVMAEVAKGFSNIRQRQGIIIGILPAAGPCETQEGRGEFKAPSGYPNIHTDLPIYTHLHLGGESGKGIASRNHIIVLSADVIVALPGGPGTRSEIQLALEYGKPLLILSPENEWSDFSSSSATLVKNLQQAMDWLNNKIPHIHYENH